MNFSNAHTLRAEAFRLRGKAVVYKTLDSAAPNLKTGGINSSYTSTTIAQVLVGFATDDDVMRSKGRYQITDRVFRFRASDLPITPPKESDVVRYNNEDYQVVGHRTDPSEYVFDVFARRL